jgi:hypothetical protein
MSEIKLNPALDLDLPFGSNTEPQNVVAPQLYKESQPVVAPITNMAQNIEVAPAATVPVAQVPMQESASSIDAINDSDKKIDTLMIVSFLLFLISLGAAAYFLYQYLK